MIVRVTEAAESDLVSIRRHITKSADAVVADEVIDRIAATIVLLRTYPRIGHRGTVVGTMERLTPRLPFVVVYRIDLNDVEEELVVLRVYHTAQDRTEP